MRSAYNFKVEERSNVELLPLINHNPNTDKCVYSTLMLVIEKAEKSGITPCITFDQPLWLRAHQLIKINNLDVVCRLLLEMINVTDIPNFQSIEDLHKRVIEQQFDTECVEKVTNSGVISSIRNQLESLKDRLKAQSRTCKLWLQYMDYVETIKLFIFAERTANWEMHLHATSRMLNLFAATGHRNYAKCARLYLQEMKQLPHTHPEIHASFLRGEHVVRRSSHSFAGIWTDLGIEQLYMRAAKTSGGLTQGRGASEHSCDLWAWTLGCSAKIHDALMELCRIITASSEQHLEMGASRRKIDYGHFLDYRSWFSSRNPFLISSENLHSLSTGVVSFEGRDDVTCEKAEEIGASIQEKFDGQSFDKASIKRKEQLKPLASLEYLKRDKSPSILMENTRLFTRTLAIANRLDSVEEAFEFELTSEPMSLFKNGMMRKSDKSLLRKALMPPEQSFPRREINVAHKTVIDGGALLHKVRWCKGMTFQQIADTYVSYVAGRYSLPTVVFDGYENQNVSTKHQEHLRRNSIPLSAFLKISEDVRMVYSQDRYFSLLENKQAFVTYLANVLHTSGVPVITCSGEADSQVVKTATGFARDTDFPVVVADESAPRWALS